MTAGWQEKRIRLVFFSLFFLFAFLLFHLILFFMKGFSLLFKKNFFLVWDDRIWVCFLCNVFFLCLCCFYFLFFWGTQAFFKYFIDLNMRQQSFFSVFTLLIFNKIPFENDFPNICRKTKFNFYIDLSINLKFFCFLFCLQLWCTNLVHNWQQVNVVLQLENETNYLIRRLRLKASYELYTAVDF